MRFVWRRGNPGRRQLNPTRVGIDQRGKPFIQHPAHLAFMMLGPFRQRVHPMKPDGIEPVVALHSPCVEPGARMCDAAIHAASPLPLPSLPSPLPSTASE